MPARGDRYDGDSSSTEDDESVRVYASAGRNGFPPSRSQYSYNNLFKLDSLLNLPLPQFADDHRSSSSSEDQPNFGQGNWRLNGHVNGNLAERPSDIHAEMTMKRRRVLVEPDAGRNSARRDDSGSNGEDEDGVTISEEHYRNMLSEHLQKYKRTRMLELATARPTAQGTKKRDRANYGAMAGDRLDANGFESSNNQTTGFVKQYVRKNRMKNMEEDGGAAFAGSEPRKDTALEHMSGPGMSGSGMLDLNADVQYQDPSAYDQVAPSLRGSDFAPLETTDSIMRSNNNATSIVPMMVADPRADIWQLRAGMRGAYEAGQPFGSMVRMFEDDSQRNLPPQVFERDLLSGFQAEGSNGQGPGVLDGPGGQVMEESGVGGLDGSQQGATMRHIASDGGTTRHCEVKLIERGDGYEIIQRKIQKEETKRDPVVLAKEDFDKIGRHWANLVRKDLPKHHKQFMTFHKRQLQDIKRFAEFCQREVKLRSIRSLKLLRSAPMRTRRLARDMVIFWKKVDKEQAELRKKEERDAADALKRNEELREAKRQQQRLNFLLTQTELYSHFMQNKLAGGTSASTDPASAAVATAEGVDEEEEEAAALKEEAVRAATEAAAKQLNKTNAFDSESSRLRQAAGGETDEQEVVPPDAVDDIDLLNPSTMPTTSSVQQPKLFHGSLKDYQLKGLQWLVNCYEQGLNGILADEMGLGKTIQAMAFLAHLAEEKNIWGPFLVVAPASVLNNWADEVSRFCPDLKILPYWGGLNERTVLRKNINPKRLYKREAVFHVLITSYQLLVSDEKYFRRVKWQYMILDEAQAIKSANSLRWKTLLSFNCRNRLLLTGTPIQNSMAELWALLHFIMPTLFDSHEQFSEWFSKGIESHAEHGGTLNEHQLTRLHAILKPFMLRRVKKDVITEMTNKKEVMVSCSLSKRQQAFYQAIKNKISVADLFDSKGALSEKKVLNLMNIVIQLRKVCNHPELFERNEGRSFLQFSTMTNALLPAAFGENESIHYSGACNPVAYKVPKLLYRDGMRCLPTSSSGSIQGFREKWLRKRLSIYSSDHVQESIFPPSGSHVQSGDFSQGGFGFSRFLDLSPAEVEFLAKAPVQERWLYSVLHAEEPWVVDYVAQQVSHPDGEQPSDEDTEDPKTRAVRRLLMLPSRSQSSVLKERHPTGPGSDPFEALVTTSTERLLKNVGLLRSVRRYIPSVQAPQIDLLCADRGFAYQRTEELEDPAIHKLLVGFGRTSDRNGPGLPLPANPLIEEVDVQMRVEQPLLALPFRIFGSAPPVQSFDFAKMLTDSGKLHTLDGLLKRLRAGNHRVLLFAQMTKMLNILEDYMNYRKYKYLRLDGSSTIMDRRDMVKDFQHRGDIFVFLLSTRAGGLGINLTAADTVIFYESDWNPTMDLQAMDRAHRLGQTKEVTVYRMICKGTVEEKILKRASQKNTVQQLVMTGQQSQGDVFQAEEVVSLLLDDAELEQRLKEQKGGKPNEKGDKRRKAGWGGSGMKGVRLDAEGGGASLDEEITAAVSEGQKVSPGGAPDSITEEGDPGAQKGGARKRRRADGKAPKPPKAPKAPKEPKPPKEPKARKERKQPRIPRPPRDPRLPRARGRPKAKAEKLTPANGAPSETAASGSSIPDGIDQSQSQPMDMPVSNGEVAMNVDGATEPVLSPEASNGEPMNTTPSSAGFPEADPSLESELLGSEVPSISEQEGGQEGNKTSASDGAVPGKVRSRGPKRMRNMSSEVENNNGAADPVSTKNRTSHPLVGTLKLSLHKQPPAEKGSPSPAEDP